MCNREANTKRKLQPMFSEKLPAVSTTSKNSIKPDSCIVNRKHKLPPISAINPVKKVSFAEQSIPSVTLSNETEQMPISPGDTIEAPANNENCTMRSQVHFFHPFRLVWLQSNTMKPNVDYEHSMKQLRRVVHAVDVFTDFQTCIDFLTTKKMKLSS